MTESISKSHVFDIFANTSLDGRKHARRQALFALYQGKMVGIPPHRLINDTDSFMENEAPGPEAKELIIGIACFWRDLEDVLISYGGAYALKRMAIIDRALLLIGSYELNFCTSVPRKEVINSINELATEYGGEDTSAPFLCRILSRLPENNTALFGQTSEEGRGRAKE